MASVTLQRINKRYSALTPVLNNINLTINEGELVVLVGPSGCGKSTLLRLIAGLESITSGNILIDQQPVADLPPRERNIAVVFQDYALYPHKSVFENMAFGLRMAKKSQAHIDERVNEVAKILQIEHLLARKPKDLSGGQRQRVAMGRAMVREPRVFLFDEPLSNLDAKLRNEMRSEIKRLHQRFNNTIIYVTHDQVEAMTLADRIAIMRNGHIEQVGTPDEIYSHPASQFVASFIGTPGMNFLPVVLQYQNGYPHLKLGQNWIPIPLSRGIPPDNLEQRALNLGIRPEHIRLDSAPQTSDDHLTEATVVLIEPLGAELQLTLALDGVEVITKISAQQTAPTVGDVVPVIIRLRYLHLFDPQSGQSLSSPPSAAQLVADDEIVMI